MEKKRFNRLIVPVIDTHQTAGQKLEKVLEEIDELLAEVSVAPVDINKLLEEYFDTTQTVFGYLRCRVAEEGVSPELIDKRVDRMIMDANLLHIEKIMNRAEERGWTVVMK